MVLDHFHIFHILYQVNKIQNSLRSALFSKVVHLRLREPRRILKAAIKRFHTRSTLRVSRGKNTPSFLHLFTCSDLQLYGSDETHKQLLYPLIKKSQRFLTFFALDHIRLFKSAVPKLFLTLIFIKFVFFHRV